MCLEVKSRIETSRPDSSFCVKDEVVIEDDFIKTELDEIVFEDVIKTELDDEDGCQYALVEIEEEVESIQTEIDEISLIEKACRTIPVLTKTGITPQKLNCFVKIQLLDTEQLTIKRKRQRRSSSKPYVRTIKNRHMAKLRLKNTLISSPNRMKSNINLHDKIINLCTICGKKFTSQNLFKQHTDWHNKSNDKFSIMTVPEEVFEQSFQQLLNSNEKTIASQNNDLIAKKLKNLTINEKILLKQSRRMPKLVPEPKEKKYRRQQEQIMPVLFPSAEPENTFVTKTELLRNPSLMIEQRNSFIELDLSSSVHETFGILNKPSFPLHINTSAYSSNKPFITEEQLQQNMTDYMTSVLEAIPKNGPRYQNQNNVELDQYLSNDSARFKTTMQRVVQQLETCKENKIYNKKQKRERKRLPKETHSDHTYAISVKKGSETCSECGFLIAAPELMDIHIDNYHTGWWLTEQVYTKGQYKSFDEIETVKRKLAPETKNNTFSENQIIKENNITNQIQKTQNKNKIGNLEKNQYIPVGLNDSGIVMQMGNEIIQCIKRTESSQEIFLLFDIISKNTALSQKKLSPLSSYRTIFSSVNQTSSTITSPQYEQLPRILMQPTVPSRAESGTLLQTVPTDIQENLEKSMKNNLIYIPVPFRPKEKIVIEVPPNISIDIPAKIITPNITEAVDKFFYIPVQLHRNKKVIIEVRPLNQENVSNIRENSQLGELENSIPVVEESVNILKTTLPEALETTSNLCEKPDKTPTYGIVCAASKLKEDEINFLEIQDSKATKAASETCDFGPELHKSTTCTEGKELSVSASKRVTNTYIHKAKK